MEKKRLFILLLALAITLVLLTGCLSGSDGKSGSKDLKPKKEVPLKLYVIESGLREIRDFTYVDPRNPERDPVESVVTSYLIEHPEGTVLWDTGFSDTIASYPEGLSVMNGGSILKVNKTMLSQLEEIGYSPDEIDYLALSHIHPDHIGNINYFQNIDVILHKEEYNSIDRNLAIFNGQGLDLEPYEILRNHKSLVQIEGSYDIFGDGSVVIIPATGHSPGHQVLLVNLPETGPVLLIGGLYMSQEFKDNYYINPYSWNKKEQAQSYILIDEIEESIGAQVWICHDSEQHSKLNYAPNFYE